MMKEHKSISIADQVFAQLEKDILTGKYPKGEVLSELRLSSEMGVSRTPIREAVRRLQQEQLLEDSGRGAVVVGISIDDTLDMYDIRLSVESMAAGRVADIISEEKLAQMREILDLQHFYIEKNDGDNSEKIRNLDSEFHELLYRCSGSRTFCSILCELHRKISKFRRASVSKHTRAVQSLSEHEKIYAALSRHDRAAAEVAAREHVENAKASLAEMEK